MSERTDRELLELAAKATGRTLDYTPHGLIAWRGVAGCPWNPLECEGDAFQLACDLQISIEQKSHVRAYLEDLGGRWVNALEKNFGEFRATATKRAIVVAAAEIGASLP